MKTNILTKINTICESVQTGDFGIVRSSGFYATAIRMMTGKGQHSPWGNHNFPIWRDENATPVILDIRAGQKTRIIPLKDYLIGLYSNSGEVVICRPSVYVSPSSDILYKKACEQLIYDWKQLEGVHYDNMGIFQILKMYFRVRSHIPENNKKQVYCTEGTFCPYPRNHFIPWNSDILMSETYPVPIHSEHLIRSGSVVFVSGEQIAWDWIRRA